MPVEDPQGPFYSHHDDRGVTEAVDGLDLAAGFNAVHLWHEHIHENQIDTRQALFPPIQPELFEGGCGAVRCDDMLIACCR